MDRFTTSVAAAISTQNWYAGLTLALALPDICGFLDDRPKGRRRYLDWCAKYLTPRYTRRIGAQGVEHVFLHPEDCYALRCALLHSGTDEIADQEIAKALQRFHFVVPPLGGGVIHCNQRQSALQLQVDIFCRDLCDGVSQWASAPDADSGVRAAQAAKLVTIHDLGRGFIF